MDLYNDKLIVEDSFYAYMRVGKAYSEFEDYILKNNYNFYALRVTCCNSFVRMSILLSKENKNFLKKFSDEKGYTIVHSKEQLSLLVSENNIGFDNLCRIFKTKNI